MTITQANVKRDIVFDALKFFAIYMVLWGHAIQWLSSTPYYDKPIYRIIYSFHMPLFMTIVGYFSTTNKHLTLIQFTLKKTRQLLLPACSFGVIFFVLGYYKWGGVKQAFGEWLYCFWFLKSAFCCTMLYYINRLWIKQSFLLFFITLLISQVVFAFKINLMYPCFLFGVFLHNQIGIIKQISLPSMCISGIVFITMLFFWDADFWLFPHDKIKIGIQENIEYYYFNGYRIVIGLFGTLFFISFFLFIFSKFKFPNTVLKIISLGQDTLGIYLLQTFLLEMLLPNLINLDNIDFIFFNFIVTPSISLAILLVCLSILCIIKKSTSLSLIFLGKKIYS